MTTDRNPSPVGSASRVLVTGASIAAGLGLVGAMGGSSDATEASIPAESERPVRVIRRVVVVPTTQPDVVLHAAGSSGVRVVHQEASAPIVRVRPAPTAGSAPAPATAPAQTTSSGS